MKKQIKLIFTAISFVGIFTFFSCNFGNTISNEKSTEQQNFDNYFSNINFSATYRAYGSVSIGPDEVYKNWNNPFLATDNHSDVLRLSFITGYDKNKRLYQITDSYVSLSGITPATDSYIVFDYKTSFYADVSNVGDIKNSADAIKIHNEKPYYSKSQAKLYVDDIFVADLGYNGNTIWRTKGVKLSAGKEHSVRWEVVTPPQGKLIYNLKNSLYLDNIKLVSQSEFEKVDISPKGQQDTVVDVPLKFSASANWTDEKPTLTCSGGTIDENGYFTATTAGDYTIQASLNGIISETIFVKVHDKNYLETESYTVPIVNYTFTGNVTDLGTEDIPEEINFPNEDPYTLSSLITFDSPTPTKKTFSADGYFVVSGKVNSIPNGYDNLYLYVHYFTNNGSSIYTSYPLEDNFYERIWLNFDRFDEGKGEYSIYLVKGTKHIGKNSKGEDIPYVSLTYSKEALFKVHNSSEYTKLLNFESLPSSFINSDSFEVSNAVHDALYGHNNASNTIKLQLIHDWIMHHIYYDYTSLDFSKREPQNSIYCLRNGKALCEGYAAVFAAMVRNIGYQAEFYASASIELNHAWNLLPWSDGSLKLVDVTWDDTMYDPDHSTLNTDIEPYSECYDYFLIDKTGIDNDHNYEKYSEARNADNSNLIPTYIGDLPDGWY